MTFRGRALGYSSRAKRSPRTEAPGARHVLEGALQRGSVPATYECQHVGGALKHADLQPGVLADLHGSLWPHRATIGGCALEGSKHVDDAAAGATARVPERLDLFCPITRGKRVLVLHVVAIVDKTDAALSVKLRLKNLLKARNINGLRCISTALFAYVIYYTVRLYGRT